MFMFFGIDPPAFDIGLYLRTRGNGHWGIAWKVIIFRSRLIGVECFGSPAL